MERFEIYADEAWTHSSLPLSRYHCFYGGIFGSEQKLATLDTRLRAIMRASNVRAEVKWSNVTERTSDHFKVLAKCLFDHISTGDVKYRQMFCDRAYVRQAEPGATPPTELDIQFKLCYQFLKHMFGIRHLPPRPSGPYSILVRLDTHSSQHHKDSLTKYLRSLPSTLNRPDITIRPTFVNSARVPLIQVCDLLMGAAGSRGNKMHLRRQNGRRGMTGRQKVRKDFAKYVYDNLRKIDADDRGSLAFNWFESTGHDGDSGSSLKHKVRIWKFTPKRYQLDDGWRNDHLDREGLYVQPILGPLVTLGEDGDA